MPVCDNWTIVDNMNLVAEIIAEGKNQDEELVTNTEIWETILKQSQYGK